MAKFKIQQNPTFSTDVEIPRIGNDPVTVKFTFKVLGRKELAALYDKWGDATKSLIERENETYVALAEADIDLQVEQIRDIVLGWGFDDEYNEENVYALCDSSVGVASAILEAYREAYAAARAKN